MHLTLEVRKLLESTWPDRTGGSIMDCREMTQGMPWRVVLEANSGSIA